MIDITDTLNRTDFVNEYSNFSLFGIGKPSKGQIRRKAKRTVGECVQPAVPQNPLNKKKWDAYRDCLKAQLQAKNEEIEIARAESQSKEKFDVGSNSENQYRESSNDSLGVDDDKILGMPKGLAIGLGIAVLAIGGFITYKIIKSKN